jgi:hypothetical protein
VVFVATALVAVLTGIGRPSVALTFTSAPAGTISPASGTYPIGSTVDVVVHPSDPTWSPALMVEDQNVTLVPAGDGWHYQYTVGPAPATIQASYGRLAKTARILDAASMAAIATVAPNGSSITFSTTTPELTALTIGQTIIGQAPIGSVNPPPPLLLVIESITPGGAGLTFGTRPGTLLDALSDASVRVSVPLHAIPGTASLVGQLAAAMTDQGEAPQPALADTGDGQVYASLASDLGHDFCSSPGTTCKISGSAKLDGNVTVLSPRLNLELDVSFFSVDRFAVSVSEHSGAEASVTIEGAATLAKEWTILQVDLANVLIMAGLVPVVLTPGFDVLGGVQAEVDGGLVVSGSIDLAASAGLTYDHGHWDDPHDFKVTTTGAAEPAGSATLELYAALKPRINVYHFCDVFTKFHVPSFSLEASDGLASGGHWTLFGGAGFNGAGAECAFGPHFEDDSLTYGVRTVLAEGDFKIGADPTSTPSPTPTQATGPASQEPASPAPTSPAVSPSPNGSTSPSVTTGELSLQASWTSGTGFIAGILTYVGDGFTPDGGVAVQVRGPDGTTDMYDQTADGTGALKDTRPFIEGAATGAWTVVVTDNATGRSVEATFNVAP